MRPSEDQFPEYCHRHKRFWKSSFSDIIHRPFNARMSEAEKIMCVI